MRAIQKEDIKIGMTVYDKSQKYKPLKIAELRDAVGDDEGPVYFIEEPQSKEGFEATEAHMLEGHLCLREKIKVTIRTTMGDLVGELWDDIAPLAVNSLVDLALGNRDWGDPNGKRTHVRAHRNTPFFNGLTFHRVIQNFIVHTGCPLNHGTGGPCYAFDDEINTTDPRCTIDGPGYFVMIMCAPNALGSQFSITAANTHWLTGQQTTFGKLTDGYDVLERMHVVETEDGDKPVEHIIIHEVTVRREDLPQEVTP